MCRQAELLSASLHATHVEELPHRIPYLVLSVGEVIPLVVLQALNVPVHAQGLHGQVEAVLQAVHGLVESSRGVQYKKSRLNAQ